MSDLYRASRHQKRGLALHARKLLAAIASFAILAGLPAQSPAQQRRSVYPDDSVVAKDAILRVAELHQAGNTTEALRVLQGIMDSDADKVLASTTDADLYYPVRRRVHELLLATPDLLARYREQEEPKAAALLARNDFAEAERTHLLCPSGFEAALRLAQLELESARFESARLMLQQLESHPDRAPSSPGAADASRLASTIAAYLNRDGSRPALAAWAAKWATDAHSGAAPAPAAPKGPSGIMLNGQGPLEGFPAPPASPVSTPLQTVLIDQGATSESSTQASEVVGAWKLKTSSWAFPTIADGRVFATDGVRVYAWDSATLGLLWSAQPANAPAAFSWGSDEALQMTLLGTRSELEDVASVTVGSGVAVTATGLPFNGGRSGDRRVHAFNAANGEPLWSSDFSYVDQRATGQRDTTTACVARGPIEIDGDTAVIAFRKPGQARRITSLYLVGVDLYAGDVRWIRTVGSYGTNPWSRTIARPDAMLLHQGVIYRSDDMGITGAYEAATGRPIWVRLSPTRNSAELSVRTEESRPPFTMHQPVPDGTSLLVIEPAFGRIVKLDMASGAFIASRDGTAFAAPSYLVKAGASLAAVGDNRIAFVPLAQFDTGTIRMTAPNSRGGFVGRVVSAGNRVIAPVADGVSIIDPEKPEEDTRFALPASGNIAVAPPYEGVGAHLLVADHIRLHTFVKWEDARALLDRRVAQHPSDAGPLITYAELARRVGKSDLIAGLADKALSILDRAAGSEASTKTRAQLFDLLIGIIADGRRAWSASADSPHPAQGEPPPPAAPWRGEPIQDPARLGEILERAARAADNPSQQAHALFERAWLRSVEKKWPLAVEALQQVLLDDTLASVPIDSEFTDPKADASLPSAVMIAREKATSMLAAVLRDSGAAAYAAFDDEAARELARLAPDADAGAATALARRYPVAAVTPELWRRAAHAHAAASRPAPARAALGAALSAAEFSVAVGRAGNPQAIGQIAGELFDMAQAPNDQEPMLRLLRRLARQYPELTLSTRAGSTTPQAASSAIARALETRTALPRIGAVALADPVQALPAWEPLIPLSRTSPGFAGSCVVMMSESAGQVALWAVGAEDGRLHQVWTRPFQARPTVVRLTPDQTILFWPTSAGGYAEAIDNTARTGAVGVTSWKTPEFASLFAQAESSEPPERFETPIDGKVRSEDFIVLCSAKELTFVQRRGRAAMFDLTNGAARWALALDVSRVFEAEICGDHLLIAGTYQTKGNDPRWIPAVIAYTCEKGIERHRLLADQLGDHPRWIRATPQGDAIVATSKGLLRYDPAQSAIKWNVTGGSVQGSIGGWILSEAAFVLTADAHLFRVALSDGAVAPEPCDTKGRAQFPLTVRATGHTIIVTSSYGIATISEKGETLGADGLDHEITHIEMPEPGEHVAVAVEADLREGDDTAARDESTLRLFMLGMPDGRLLGVQRVRLYDSPHAITLLDGKIIIPAGAVTLVVDAPAQ